MRGIDVGATAAGGGETYDPWRRERDTVPSQGQTLLRRCAETCALAGKDTVPSQGQTLLRHCSGGKHAAIGDDLRTRVDRALGERVGYAFKNHHRRRLARIGWAHALDAPAGGWAAGDPPPRSGNTVEVLVDGAEYLPRVAEAIRAAASHVHVTGWFLSPEFALERGERQTVLRNLLAEAAERVDVRVLAWAGAPLPLLTPWRGDVRTMRERLTRGTRIRCAPLNARTYDSRIRNSPRGVRS